MVDRVVGRKRKRMWSCRAVVGQMECAWIEQEVWTGWRAYDISFYTLF